MSKTILKNRDFIGLVLKGVGKQARALLDTISGEQTEALVEILYNLGKIASRNKDKAVIGKRRLIIKKLLNKKTTLKKKAKLVSKHKLQLLKTLIHFRGVLLSLVK